ncbi:MULTISPECIES: DUF3365 domain-containing protein [Gimesia]|uniref:c-type heme family protein n=1 Tax=Gimesia TaxID=1649453 RepID=UPI00119DFC8A|nr:DUF3365 domain-containing protein [Gimesia chilikensis]
MMIKVSVMLCGCVLACTLVSFAEPPGQESLPQAQGLKRGATKKTDEKQLERRMSIDEARLRARLTHNIYSATLDSMHRSYFINERAAVPARVMQRMFDDVEEVEKIKARWIAVNARAMSIDHEPKTDFEKKAAQELASGKEMYEKVENGVYQRAGAISLMHHGCLSCHVGFGKKNTKDRFAGLIISIPIK